MPGRVFIVQNNRHRLHEAFRAFVATNQRDVEFLFQDQGRKLAVDIFTATKGIAPTPAEITADVQARGWKIPKWFHTGGTRGWRTERGPVSLWAGATQNDLDKKNARGKKLTKKDRRNAALLQGNKPTLQMMEAFVIGLRKKASRFLATGWLGAISDLGGSPSGGEDKVDHTRGGAFITRNKGKAVLTLWNRTPGICTVQAKKHFLEHAVANRVASMWQYVKDRTKDAKNTLHKTH